MRTLVIRLLAAGLLGCAMVFFSAANATAESPAVDLIVVIKSERVMYLYADGLPIKSFDIGLGDSPAGDKREEGDEKTPEGAYVLDWRNPDSLYHRSIHISYPNAQDRARAQANGVDPGGMIMIHGQPNYAFEERVGDWTNGCIAISNRAIDYMWQHVPMGTPIHILP